MNAHEKIKSMLDSHLESRLTEIALKRLIVGEPDTSNDYWLGYKEGVAFGYRAALEAFEK